MPGGRPPKSSSPPPPEPDPAGFVTEGAHAPYRNPRTYGDYRAARAATAPESVAELERQERLDAQRIYTDAMVDDRDRREAEALDIPYDEWRAMSPRTRAGLMARAELYGSEPDGVRGVAPEHFDTIPQAMLAQIEAQEIVPPQVFEDLTRRVVRVDEQEHYTLMADPPVEFQDADGVVRKYHPGWSTVSRKDMTILRRLGFWSYPRYPFLPAPHLPCVFNGSGILTATGQPCDYKGRFEHETTSHMLACHPQEYASWLRAEERRWREDEAQAARATREALLALAQDVRGQRAQPAGA